MSHSKRNTSRAVFTSHERTLAKAAWSSSSARLTRESFLPFAACRLCLEPAVDPVACPHGDIFCRECALENLLAQKKEIKRLGRLREQELKESGEKMAQQEAEERDRAVHEFELTQNGLETKRRKDQRDGSVMLSNVSEPEETRRASKRKFQLDEEELLRIANEDRAKARKAIADEKASAPKLPSFWTPSVTPSSNTNNSLYEVQEKIKTSPVCPASPEDNAHNVSLAVLMQVNFAEELDEKSKTLQRICPSCKKVLSNASKAVLTKPCGHVLCSSCVKNFMHPSSLHDPHASDREANNLCCYVCSTSLTENPSTEKSDKIKKRERERIRPGLVAIRSEGTGFSAGGANQVKKSGVAFQC